MRFSKFVHLVRRAATIPHFPSCDMKCFPKENTFTKVREGERFIFESTFHAYNHQNKLCSLYFITNDNYICFWVKGLAVVEAYRPLEKIVATGIMRGVNMTIWSWRVILGTKFCPILPWKITICLTEQNTRESLHWLQLAAHNNRMPLNDNYLITWLFQRVMMLEK